MTRLRFALAAVIVTALLPTVGIFVALVSNPAMLRARDDPMSMFERRLAPVREAIRGERAVGFWTPQAEDHTAHLYNLRYALAPVLVVDDPDLPIVVADRVTDPRALPPQLRVRRDFGQGLLLLERAPQ
jgi:hypothetical protein